MHSLAIVPQNRVLAPQQDQTSPSSDDTYLKFYLDQQTLAILPMRHTQEVFVVPPQLIALIPNMPVFVLGLLNRRSRVLWAVDLAQMLQLQSLDANTHQYNVAVISVGEVLLGLVVGSIQGVIRLTPDCIQPPPPSLRAGLASYVQGCVFQQANALLMLDPEVIMRSSVLHGS